jgi:hypothetical protein
LEALDDQGLVGATAGHHECNDAQGRLGRFAPLGSPARAGSFAPAGGFGRDVVAGYRFDALSFRQLHLELHRGLLQNFPCRRIFSTPGQPIHCASIPNGSKRGSATAPTQLASTGVAANGSVGSVPDKCRVHSVFWFRAQDAERLSLLPMWKTKGKVPRQLVRPVLLAAKQSAKQSAKQLDQSPVGGLAPAHPRSAEWEVIVSRVRRFSPWVLLGILAPTPLAPAAGQNLDAGKPASQIFAEVCANCHRSPRELRGNPGTSFLREHYTTGSDMASTMSAYLSSFGGDPRVGGTPQPKRQPQTNPATTTTRDAPAADQPRRAQQTADPKDPKAAAAAPATTRGRPASVAETKPPSPPAPTRPVLEDFEE